MYTDKISFNSAKISFEQGGNFDEKAQRYKSAIEEKKRLVGLLRQKNYDKIANNPNAQVIDGKASFVTSHKVNIQTENGLRVLTADKFFINTGSYSFIQPIKGLKESCKFYTSTKLLDE